VEKFRAVLVLSVFLGFSVACGNSHYTGASSEAEFVDQFRAAFESKDVDRVVSFWYLDGAKETHRQKIKDFLVNDFKSSVLDVRMTPIDKNHLLEYTHLGITYRPTLTPIGEVKLELKLPGSTEGKGAHTSSFLVGKKRGAFYVTPMLPQ
jgi:hypothetical protein